MKVLIYLVTATCLLTACGAQPMALTHNGQACHRIGNAWSPAMVAPDNSTLCW